MKIKLLGMFVFLISVSSFSQFTSLNVTMDARSIAMGESFVANANGLVSADNNPATLASLNGLSVFYNRRNFNYSNNQHDRFYYSFGAGLKTTIGNFSFLYKRFNDDINDYPGPECIYFPRPYYNYTAIISYAKNIFGGFSIGVSLKTHAYKTEINNSEIKEAESNNPILADVGILYHSDGLINNASAKDEVNLGASLMNYGTDYKVKGYAWIHGEQKNVVAKLPRMLKLGFAYQINIIDFSPPDFLKFTFTGEYDRVLNKYNYGNFPQIDYYGYNFYEKDIQKDVWKAGIESTVMDILALRVGGVSYSFYNYYAEEGKVNLRYGLGVNLPLELIGINYPISLCFDYAVM